MKALRTGPLHEQYRIQVRASPRVLLLAAVLSDRPNSPWR